VCQCEWLWLVGGCEWACGCVSVCVCVCVSVSVGGCGCACVNIRHSGQLFRSESKNQIFCKFFQLLLEEDEAEWDLGPIL
jgi:hypothetical protein